jgi:hypothetical protein
MQPRVTYSMWPCGQTRRELAVADERTNERHAHLAPVRVARKDDVEACKGEFRHHVRGMHETNCHHVFGGAFDV